MMLRVVAGLLLAVGALLLTVTSPWLWLGGRQVGPVDWTPLFWSGQWAGFWLVASSVAVHAAAWARHRGPPSGWLAAATALGLALCAAFFVWSAPERSNERRWARGALGIAEYVRAKARRREDALGAAGVPARFAGTWRAADGSRLTVTAAGAAEWRVGCAGGYQATYRLASRTELLARVLGAEGQAVALGEAAPGDHPYAVLLLDCAGERDTFVLLDSGGVLWQAADGRVELLAR